MKKIILLLTICNLTNVSYGQSDFAIKEYKRLSSKADSLYSAKDYKNSGLTYSSAFQFAGTGNDHYNAACSWALANYADSAFSQLNLISDFYKNYNHITTDSDLKSIHNDIRWKPLIDKIKQNLDKAEALLNKPLVAQLDSIHNNDQKYRLQIEAISKKYGWESKETKALWKTISETDSINLIKIQTILDKYGWLGTEVIGSKGNSTLFLVIQHSDQKTQEKYLPMMKDAVKNGKAFGSDLALLEDRVLLGQGKKQLYGSQIGRDTKTTPQTFYVLPLADPDNVDKRRASVGLSSLADYVANWQIKWDVEQYKKDLPTIEAKQKEIKK